MVREMSGHESSILRRFSTTLFRINFSRDRKRTVQSVVTKIVWKRGYRIELG